MLNNNTLNKVQKLLNNKNIIDGKLLSDSFGINCIKVKTDDKMDFIIKYYDIKKNENFNAIQAESNNLKYFNNLKINFFPKVIVSSNNYLVMSFISNDRKLPNETKKDFLKAITSIHLCKKKNYGFDFDTQIGGLKQINKINDNWIEFYSNYRLGYIFDLICSSNPMSSKINKKIETIIKKLENYIPKKPESSLLHGDLWEGNILFFKEKFAGFIDPGSFYGHNELEIAYLRWFNPEFIKKNFMEEYNDIIKIDKEYYNYEPIYQLYYSLLNVYLWDRIYIKDVERLLKHIKI